MARETVRIYIDLTDEPYRSQLESQDDGYETLQPESVPYFAPDGRLVVELEARK